MKILFHICCAPCAIYPVKEMRSSGMTVTGYFFNHNIHPFLEYRKRLETVQEYAAKIDLDVIYRDEYRLEDFLEAVAGSPQERCLYCYSSRLEAVAAAAVKGGFDAYSSSLLYSRFQKHDLIRELGEQIGARYLYSLPLQRLPTWLEGRYRHLEKDGPLPPAILRLHLQ